MEKFRRNSIFDKSKLQEIENDLHYSEQVPLPVQPETQIEIARGVKRRLVKMPINCPVCRMRDENGSVLLPPYNMTNELFTHIVFHMLRRKGFITDEMFVKLRELVNRDSDFFRKNVTKYTEFATAEGRDSGLVGERLQRFIDDYIDEECIALTFETWHKENRVPKTNPLLKVANSIKGIFGWKRTWDKPVADKTGLEVAIDIIEGRISEK